MNYKFLIVLITLIILIPFPPALAINMNSDAYKLQFTNLNMTSGSKSSENFQILDTLGQFAPGEYASSGFYVKAGFPYIKTIIPFSFSISDLSIDFGTLSPSTFATLTNTLTVSFGAAGGYSVVAHQDHPLKLQTGSTTIPDTTCDTACDETTAAVWINTTNYGFGYNMSGHDVPAAFVDNTYFKQFADNSIGESDQIVMSSANVGIGRTATVTYKVNVGATQAAGDYENSIVFIATPTY